MTLSGSRTISWCTIADQIIPSRIAFGLSFLTLQLCLGFGSRTQYHRDFVTYAPALTSYNVAAHVSQPFGCIVDIALRQLAYFLFSDSLSARLTVSVSASAAVFAPCVHLRPTALISVGPGALFLIPESPP